MNEYGHIPPNVTNYNSNCIKIQNLFQERLNPQVIQIKFDQHNDGTHIPLYKRFYHSNVSKEIKQMNPDMQTITVLLVVRNQTHGNIEPTYKTYVDTFNETYPRFFKTVMDSIKNNEVHVPVMIDRGAIREGKDGEDPADSDIDPDLGLTVCDYINLEITQPKKYGYGKVGEKSIRIDIIYTFYEKNLFEFVLRFNYFNVVKRLIRIQSDKSLNVAEEIPMQSTLIRAQPTFTVYPNDDVDERQYIQGSKHRGDTGELVHTTNNTRFARKNEDVSAIPLANDVQKYKPILFDIDGVFNQIHDSRTINGRGLTTVKARFQKYVDVTQSVKTRKNKGSRPSLPVHRGGRAPPKSKSKFPSRSSVKGKRRRGTRKRRKGVAKVSRIT